MINIAVRDLDGQVHEIEAHDGDSLMETLREFEWGVPAICGGLCSCGTCHVYLDEDWMDKFTPPDPDEQDLLEVTVVQIVIGMPLLKHDRGGGIVDGGIPEGLRKTIL